MRQEERRARTRAALTEAASEYIAREGYDGASLDALAASAGLSKGAVYAHFPSKVDLFIAVVEEALAEAMRRVEAVAEAIAAGVEPATAARRYLGERNGARHVGLMPEIWRGAVREDAIRERLDQYRDARLACLGQAAVEAGGSPDTATRLAELTARLIDAEILERRLSLASTA